MNKKLLAVAMNLVLLTSAAAYAQTIHLKVTVPFKFTVGSSTLPPGEYDVESTGAARNILTIRRLSSKGGGVFAMSGLTESMHASPQTKLVFRHYGRQYFLAQVWVQ